MNKIKGKILKIEEKKELSLFLLECNGVKVNAFVIGEDEDNFKEGEELFILFKESETILAKEFKGAISVRNRFSCKVKDVKRGEILSEITLSFFEDEIVSIISALSCKEMGIKKGDLVEAFVKTNEITLMRIADG